MFRAIPLGLAPLQALPSVTGKYVSSLFITVVAVVFISTFVLLLENVFFIIANSCVRKKVLSPMRISKL